MTRLLFQPCSYVEPARPPSSDSMRMTTIRSDIPARLDRLPWSRWHWRVVIALGVAWILDGLEVTLVGSIGAVLERGDTLGLSAVQIGWSGSLYVAGAVAGALLFGRLADRLGRKKLYLVTPARVRGRVNLASNGSFWIGAARGAALSLVLLDPRVLGPVLGWRAGFILGALMAVAILLVRRAAPDRPRWLLSHGREEEARRIVEAVEAQIILRHGPLAPPGGHLVFAEHASPSLREVAHVLLRRYRARSLVT